MADVKSFPGVSLPDQPLGAQPCPEVVARLKELTKMAERGEIQAVAFTYVDANGRNSYGWSGLFKNRAVTYAMHSGLATATTDLGMELANGATDSTAIKPDGE